ARLRTQVQADHQGAPHRSGPSRAARRPRCGRPWRQHRDPVAYGRHIRGSVAALGRPLVPEGDVAPAPAHDVFVTLDMTVEEAEQSGGVLGGESSIPRANPARKRTARSTISVITRA